MTIMTKRTTGVVLIGAGFLLGACATTATERVDQRVLDKLAGFKETGETETCISVPRLKSIDPATESKFLVETGFNDYWLVNTNGRCSGSTRPQNRLQYSTSISQLCRGQIIKIIDNQSGLIAGSCSIGTFKKLEPKADN